VTDIRLDVGLVVHDSAAALAFYRDTLGLEQLDDLELSVGVMHRLRWGDSLVKLTRPRRMPDAANPQGGHLHATGLRYITLVVPDLDALLTRCEQDGYRITIPRTQVRPGVEVAFVSDPDGNAVEFLQA
jgi:catechol 2,3-dioxygenase-like lactoylglutathione lyase family enzyme